mmetsp:Transcript_32744/g.74227  ORF Transcript_32744/g.74227 Transcript_32744/m.74227 type:complete len:202 (-) Transcript_32744:472-1077(-)
MPNDETIRDCILRGSLVVSVQRYLTAFTSVNALVIFPCTSGEQQAFVPFYFILLFQKIWEAAVAIERFVASTPDPIGLRLDVFLGNEAIFRSAYDEPVTHGTHGNFKLVALAQPITLIKLLRLPLGFSDLLVGTFGEFLELVLIFRLSSITRGLASIWRRSGLAINIHGLASIWRRRELAITIIARPLAGRFALVSRALPR